MLDDFLFLSKTFNSNLFKVQKKMWPPCTLHGLVLFVKTQGEWATYNLWTHIKKAL